MSKIISRTLLVLAAAGLILLLVLRNRSPFGRQNSSFSSEPKELITAIEFNEKGKKLALTREGDEWLVNGNIRARKTAVLFIEKILKDMQIKSPVSPKLYKKEVLDRDIDPVKVKVYERRRLIKSFLVYKTGSNIYGNIMKLKEKGKPFIVYVPGFDSDIGSGFTVNELFWEPYTVFNLLPSEILSVRFENLSDTASSFLIVREGNNYLLKGQAGWDSSMVRRYLSYFTWIPFENWAFETVGRERDEIESQLPLYRITVVTKGGASTILTLWEKKGSDGKGTDSDRLWGKTRDTEELFIMRYFDIDPLIKKRSYFYPE